MLGPVVMHPHHVVVTVDTVSRLVAEQCPRWVDLPIREVASHGTVNALFRIGDRFAARFPLEPGDVEGKLRWLTSEAQAAGELLGRTRFPTPEPIALGEPGAGYPLPWSVQTWVPGTDATAADPASPSPWLMTLPSSSRACARSTPAAGCSRAPDVGVL